MQWNATIKFNMKQFSQNLIFFLISVLLLDAIFLNKLLNGIWAQTFKTFRCVKVCDRSDILLSEKKRSKDFSNHLKYFRGCWLSC